MIPCQTIDANVSAFITEKRPPKIFFSLITTSLPGVPFMDKTLGNSPMKSRITLPSFFIFYFLFFWLLLYFISQQDFFVLNTFTKKSIKEHGFYFYLFSFSVFFLSFHSFFLFSLFLFTLFFRFLLAFFPNFPPSCAFY